MNILMITNTFSPHVGGVARSVEAFTAEYKKMGHGVMVIAPEFQDMPEREEGVLRIPALQHFNGSDFSVRLPVPVRFTGLIEAFKPDLIHSHHPFMLGSTAFRLAHHHRIPLVFTHHTMYEEYTHYVPGNSATMKRFAITLGTGYANLCDRVFAPSESVAEVLAARGVETPIDVVPTGVNTHLFDLGHGGGLRAALGIPEDAFVVGHVGRLAPEKNLPFLTEGVSAFMKRCNKAHFVLVGDGPSIGQIKKLFADPDLAPRFHYLGTLSGPLLVSAYKSMDIFAFASLTETQGMVLTEAMSAGAPVIALDAPGAREVVVDGENGRLLYAPDKEEFRQALEWAASLSVDSMAAMRRAVKHRAKEFSIERCAEKAIHHYEEVLQGGYVPRRTEDSPWESTLDLIKAEWDIVSNAAEAAVKSVRKGRKVGI